MVFTFEGEMYSMLYTEGVQGIYVQCTCTVFTLKGVYKVFIGTYICF